MSERYTYVFFFHKPGSKILRRILSPSWDSEERPTSVANKQIFTLLVLIKDSNTYMPKNRTHFSYRFRIYVSHSMLMTFLGSFLLDKHCIFFFLFLKNFWFVLAHNFGVLFKLEQTFYWAIFQLQQPSMKYIVVTQLSRQQLSPQS